MFHEFFDLPWSSIASFLTTLSLAGLFLGPRLKWVRTYIGSGLQEMLGVTPLRADISAIRTGLEEETETRTQMHAQNQRELHSLKSQIIEVSTLAAEVAQKTDMHYSEAKQHYTDQVLHDGTGHG